ncbi:MAG: hypothetical protein JNL70_14625 [Saprospiraceae bacterium]|nr:hypothetical protein [Saprospiraceae bacterium]
MKNVCLVFALWVASFQVSKAQDCSQGFYAMKEGTKFSMTNYNDKGKITSTSSSVVKSIKADGAKFEATIEASAKDGKDKPILDGKNFTVTCDNGTIKLDISSMMMADFANQMKNMEVSISGSGIEIPSNLSEGMSLSDGTTEMKLGTNGVSFMTMKFDIKNRKVEAKESKTTPAGTFDCYKITYDMDMKTIMKRQMKVVQWMAPGVGLVRSESFNQKGELEGYSELTKFEKP